MNTTFCAINTTILDKLINKNNIPIVYYFDGISGDLIFDIMKSKEFYNCHFQTEFNGLIDKQIYRKKFIPKNSELAFKEVDNKFKELIMSASN